MEEFQGGGRIEPLLKNLQWMEEFNGGGRIKPLLKIFNECKSLRGVGEFIWDVQCEEKNPCNLRYSGLGQHKVPVGNITYVCTYGMNGMEWKENERKGM